MDDAAPHAEAADGAARADAEGPADAADTLRRELAECQDRLLRAVAETDNVRRRSQREREDYVRYANEILLRDLVPVLDNFDRALAAARTTGEGSGVIEGVELIQRELLRVLEKSGLSRYSAVGERFDPARHEAVGRLVSAEHPPDTVVTETVPGYRLHGRVLRAPLVVVAAPPEEGAD